LNRRQTKPMTTHKTGTREEWLAARLELLKAEKELTRRGDELAQRRQELPWVRIEKEYRFETDEGRASLADLFRGRSQLLVYHFMFGPDYKAGCPSCSSIADGFNGFAVHLANHDVMLWAVSRAPLAKLQEYKRRMGWTFPSRCCASVIETSKSKLKSAPSEEAQGNVHPIRCLKACSFAHGARDTAQSITSWFARWTAMPLNPSAMAEQEAQPAL